MKTAAMIRPVSTDHSHILCQMFVLSFEIVFIEMSQFLFDAKTNKINWVESKMIKLTLGAY